jgi:stage II sporulation protein R
LQEAESLLMDDGADVLQTVERVLAEEGCAYNAQLRFGKMSFPEKVYGSTIYPAGEYTALRVELGTASGENWWCVLFPPICLVDIGVSDKEGSDEIVFESDLAQWLGLR